MRRSPMADVLADEDEIRRECRKHTLTVTPHLDFRGPAVTEPVLFDIDCSCGGIHMGGNVGEIMTLIQAHLRGHGIPVSQWWPRLRPDHPRMAAHA